MTKVNKIPPLQCPQCKSTHVTKNNVGTIGCDDCKKETLYTGKVRKIETSQAPWTKKRNYPEGFFE